MNKTKILTSHIDLSIDKKWLFENFKISKVDYSSGQGKGVYKSVQTSLRNSWDSNLIAFVTATAEKCVYVLHRNSHAIAINNESVTIKLIDDVSKLGQIGDVLLARLLIRAIPTLIETESASMNERSENQNSSTFFADGLYYEVKYKRANFGSKLPVIIAVEIEIQGDKTTAEPSVTLKTRTFRPIDSFDSNNTYDKRFLDKNPSTYDLTVQGLRGIKAGSYVKKGYGNFRKNKVDMVSTENFEKYRQSKMGVLSRFIEDLRRAYGDAVTLKFRELSSAHYYVKTNTAKEYAYIWNTLGDVLATKGGIQIIDARVQKDNPAAMQIKEKINALLNDYSYSSEIPITQVMPGFEKKNIPTIIIVETDSYYKENNLPDIYQEFKRLHPNTPSQALTSFSDSENLSSSDALTVSNSVIEVLLKELLIKIEVLDQKIYLEGYAKNDTDFIASPHYQFILPYAISYSDNASGLSACEWRYISLTHEKNKLVFTELGTINNILDEYASLGNTMLNANVSRFVIPGTNTTELCPFIYDTEKEVIFALVNTETRALPYFAEINKVMKGLYKGEKQGIPRKLLTDFCYEHEASHVELVKTLLAFLTNTIIHRSG